MSELFNETAKAPVPGPMVVSRCINGLGRVEYLLLFSAVLNSFKLLMMTEKFCKNLVNLSDWAVKYRMTVHIYIALYMGSRESEWGRMRCALSCFLDKNSSCERNAISVLRNGPTGISNIRVVRTIRESNLMRH